LLNEPALAEHLAGNARRLVEQRYTWKAVAARYEAVLAAVTGRCAPPAVGLTA
jgi:glycosyltransferase involved in cell wall biosynthesis